MNFEGKFVYLTDTPSGKRPTTAVVRQGVRGYEGEVIADHGGCELMENVHTKGNTFCFEAVIGPCRQEISLTCDGDQVSGHAIVHQDDGRIIESDLEACTFTPKTKRRALILYASMTKNTERVAKAMAETFEYYNWEATLFKMTLKPSDWEGMQDQLYFDDYDVVCLGSPIVAGYPLTVVNKVFSLGAGGQLEANVQKQVDAGKGFHMNADTMKGPPGGESSGGPGRSWRSWWSGRSRESRPSPPPAPSGRRRLCPYPADRPGTITCLWASCLRPMGAGSTAPMRAWLPWAALKLFLELNNVTVLGQFACCGKEFGPAGLEEGEKPRLMGPGEMPDPKIYELADGTKVTSSYFFHGQPWNHPCQRDIDRAKTMVCDLVEDYFMTYDGKRAQVCSQYISIS